MAKATDIQLRGHCQYCGREQAVMDGHMSHHGYTVPNGQFVNTCDGQQHKPVQRERKMADIICVSHLAQAERSAATAEAYRSGRKLPDTVLMDTKYVRQRDPVTGIMPKGHWDEIRVPYAEAPAYKQQQEVQRKVHAFEQDAQANRAFAEFLAAVVKEFHGKELRKVDKADKPAPICIGDKRASAGWGTVVCTSVDRGRVYFRQATPGANGKRATSWTGTQSWRKMDAP